MSQEGQRERCRMQFFWGRAPLGLSHAARLRACSSPATGMQEPKSEVIYAPRLRLKRAGAIRRFRIKESFKTEARSTSG